MSFKSVLKLNGKEWKILSAEYKFHQEVDATGRPSSVVRGGEITLTTESTGDTSFFEHMVDSFDRKDGSIVYSKRDTDATLKELKFKEAYMVRYKEQFDSTGTNPLVETFTFSALHVSMGTGEFDNAWV